MTNCFVWGQYRNNGYWWDVTNINPCSFIVCKSQHYLLTVAYGPDLNKTYTIFVVQW